MKIIGRSGDGWHQRHIVDMSHDELAHVCGFGYASGDDFLKHLASLGVNDRERQIKLGVEIPVSDFWNRFHAIRQNEAALRKLAGTMRTLADLLDQSSPAAIVAAIVEGEKS